MFLFGLELSKEIPDLRVATVQITDVKIEARNDELERLKSVVVEEVRSKYSLESVKDVRRFRFYRDFFWKLGIDPTKTRPASEALVRRILQGGSIPAINTGVDAINVASIRTEIVVDAFDIKKIVGNAKIRFASEGEKFLGIGMKHELILRGGEIVISDVEGPIAVYPHRDAERTRLTHKTTDVLTVSCGVPGIKDEELINAAGEVSQTIIRFCGGIENSEITLLPSQEVSP